MKHTIVVAVALSAIAAPAASQTYLDQLISKLSKKKGTSTPASAVGGQFGASISPTQTATINRLLSQPIQDPKASTARSEAAPLIKTVLSTASCATASEAWNAVNRFHMTPTTYRSPFYGELVPMGNLKYHDKTRCLEVARLTDWSMPAANALKFRAFYIAEDSGEAKRQTFELQKASDGQWMIREIGSGLN